MNNNEILKVLNEIIEDYLIGKYDRSKAVDKLITSIKPEEIYDLGTNPLITDCYFAIKHLTEKGFETTTDELVYLRDCIKGIREYNLDVKNRFIQGKHE
jgi:hypothetical protein